MALAFFAGVAATITVIGCVIGAVDAVIRYDRRRMQRHARAQVTGSPLHRPHAYLLNEGDTDDPPRR